MVKAILVSIAVGIVSAHAAPTPSINCKYPTGQIVTYQGAGSIDITNPTDSGYGGEFQQKSIPLLINGQGPVEHSVNVVSTRRSIEVIYKSVGQFFVNDITIRYVLPYQGSEEREFVSGIHQTDGSTIQLACSVNR